MATFRLLHFSDLHLGEREFFPSPEDRMIARLMWGEGNERIEVHLNRRSQKNDVQRL